MAAHNTPTMGAKAGMSGRQQMIALGEMMKRGGRAQMCEIYEAVEKEMHLTGYRLSHQGLASLRFFVNRRAAGAGFVTKDPEGGWRITGDTQRALKTDPLDWKLSPTVGVHKRRK